MSRTIRKCICDSTKKIDAHYGSVLPLCLPKFIHLMARILAADSMLRLHNEMPSVKIGNEKYYGQAIEKPTAIDIIDFLRGGDLLRGCQQTMQLQGFLEWFLDQSEPEDEVCWYDDEFVIEKWNEYAEIRKEDHRQWQ